ncbi:response regulator transcription factor [Paenibacillus sp. Marseille-Q4541]|uniref:response regulator transcription factor n=1 Tax=Paenibacillus sp. Marseille-Q4541 TaxID=2831522 RepID=UPI001BA4C3D9|nr:response regulator transcription factor [Paenibacillus sp. Marseille-Q4541]
MRSLCKVIIVDDEMLVRQGIKHLLDWEQAGFCIVGEASNGLEALDLVEELQPHIVITDIVMPIMDGEKLVRVVKERYPAIEVIVLSSFSEFDYVRSTFQNGVADYILKPKLEAEYLLSILNKTAARIEGLGNPVQEERSEENQIEQAIDRMISGYEAELSEEVVSRQFPYEKFVLIGVDLKRMKESTWQKNIEKQWDRYMEQFGTQQAKYMKVRSLSGTLLYLLNADDPWKERIEHCKQFISRIVQENTQQIPLHFVFSDRFTDFFKLGEVYRDQYEKLKRYSFYLPTSLVLERSHLPALPESLSEIDMAELVDGLKRKQFHKAFTTFLEHVHFKSLDYETDVFEFKSLLGNFIFNVTNTLGKLKYEIVPLENKKYDYFRQIDEAMYARDAILLIEKFIQEVEGITSETESSVNPGIHRLLTYIQEHYAEPITLTEVAKEFHFNASYLSSYFSANNNEGFSEYLNKVRVEKAKEMLVFTDESISEISDRVGYSDQSYFTKVFKKMTGGSPSQYRKEQVQEKQNL